MIYNIQRKDGLGTQVALFAKGVIGQGLDDRFIFDIRKWQFFRNNNDFNFRKISNLFEFHPQAIVDPHEIDLIVKENRCRYISNTNFSADIWTRKHPDKKFPWWGNVEPYLLMKLKNPPKLNYEIGECVGIHARLGNGEENRKYYDIPTSIKHRIVDENCFVDEMRQRKNVNFFISSDSKKFIDRCTTEFGNRVKTIERIHMPEGCGPGHVRHIPKSNSIEFHDSVDSVDLLYEAYVDMYLLSHCSSLICNQSMFNWLARNNIADSNKVKEFKNENRSSNGIS